MKEVRDESKTFCLGLQIFIHATHVCLVQIKHSQGLYELMSNTVPLFKPTPTVCWGES